MKKKIGFIAMSGVRAQNEELMKLGLTLPGFVERSKVIASLPSLSLLTVSGHAALSPAQGRGPDPSRPRLELVYTVRH
jgi:hypothetical protein